MSFSSAQYALSDDLVVLAIINHCDTYKDYRQLRSTSRVFYRVAVQQQHKYTQKDQKNEAARDTATKLLRQYFAEKMVGEEEALRRESEMPPIEILVRASRISLIATPHDPRDSSERMALLCGSGLWHQLPGVGYIALALNEERRAEIARENAR
jgi:hypothetical protein